MTSPSPADHAESASPASPQLRGRRRPALRRIWRVVLFLALAAGVFGLLPGRGGGLRLRLKGGDNNSAERAGSTL